MAWVGASTDIEPSKSPGSPLVTPVASTESPRPLVRPPADALPESGAISQATAEAARGAAIRDSSQLAETEPEIKDAQPAAHTVKPGDTLTRISEQYDVSISALLNANNLPNPDYLEVGQVINLAASAGGIYAVVSHCARLSPSSFDWRIWL